MCLIDCLSCFPVLRKSHPASQRPVPHSCIVSPAGDADFLLQMVARIGRTTWHIRYDVLCSNLDGTALWCPRVHKSAGAVSLPRGYFDSRCRLLRDVDETPKLILFRWPPQTFLATVSCLPCCRGSASGGRSSASTAVTTGVS